MFAASTGPAEVVILIVLVAYIPALVVAGMKGRWYWFAAGLFFWPFAVVGALLSPKPDSSWANRNRSAT